MKFRGILQPKSKIYLIIFSRRTKKCWKTRRGQEWDVDTAVNVDLYSRGCRTEDVIDNFQHILKAKIKRNQPL